MAKQKFEKTLPADVAKKYKCVGIRPGKFNFGGNFGEIDLRSISLKKADELYANKFSFLVLVDTPKPVKTDKKGKDAPEAEKEPSDATEAADELTEDKPEE